MIRPTVQAVFSVSLTAVMPVQREISLDRIAIFGVIIILGLLLLAEQRYCANKRLANKTQNRDER